MRATSVVVAAAVLLVAGACKDLVVPDYNNTSLDDLTNNPTPTKITQASQGLLVGTRVGIGEQNGYVSLLGILGRESYNFDPADPRFITEMLIGPLDGGSPAFGGNLFADPYRNIRNANILLGAVDKVIGLSASQKSAVQGFAKTIEALEYLNVVNTRDDLGAPLDVNIGPTAAPAPIVAKAAVIRLAAEYSEQRHVAILLADSYPRPDQQTLRRLRDLCWSGVVSEIVEARVVEVRDHEVLACAGEEQHGDRGDHARHSHR